MIVLVLLTAALAQDPPPAAPTASTPDPGTIVVWGSRDPKIVRAEIDEQLKKMGFVAAIRVGDKVIYNSLRAGYGRVEVWDDGRYHVIVPTMALQSVAPQHAATLQAGPPNAPGIGTGLDAGASRTPTFGPVFAVNGRRVSIKRQADITEAIAPKMREWNDAIADEALAARIDVLKRDLREDWAGPGDAATRRARIAARWLATADSPAGAKVRAAIRTFVATNVTPSGQGYTEAEIAALDARRLFPDDWAGVSPRQRTPWTPPPPVATTWSRVIRPGAPLVLAGIDRLPPEVLAPKELGLVE